MSNEEKKDTSVAVSEAIEAVEKEADVNSVTFSTGVKLRIKSAALGILIKVMAYEPRPEPYRYEREPDKMLMTNTDHPDYIKAVQAWEARQNEMLLNAIIGLATEIESKPRGMKGPDDDEWMEIFEVLKIQTLPENKRWRYLNWVLLNAVVTQEDFQKLTEVAKASGIAITEKAVAEAASFPGRNETG